MCLTVPVTYEFVMVMFTTMDDIAFFETELPKLKGCVDEYDIKEALDASIESTNDQLILHYI